MTDETAVGVAPDCSTELAEPVPLAWAEDDDAAGEVMPSRWRERLRWAGPVAAFAVSAAALVAGLAVGLQTFAAPVAQVAPPAPPAAVSAPAITVTAPPPPASVEAAPPPVVMLPPTSMGHQDATFLTRERDRGKTIANRSLVLANAHYFCTSVAGTPDADTKMAARMGVDLDEAVAFDTDAVVAYDDC